MRGGQTKSREKSVFPSSLILDSRWGMKIGQRTAIYICFKSDFLSIGRYLKKTNRPQALCSKESKMRRYRFPICSWPSLLDRLHAHSLTPLPPEHTSVSLCSCTDTALAPKAHSWSQSSFLVLCVLSFWVMVYIFFHHPWCHGQYFHCPQNCVCFPSPISFLWQSLFFPL